MASLLDAKHNQSETRSRSGVVHLVVVLVLSALPAAAAMAFPPTVLADKNETFLTLYAVTLPWSLALSAIVAGFAGGWFGSDERKQVLAAAGIVLVSSSIGAAIAPGSPVDEHFRGGRPWVVVAELIVFGVIGYALMYGWPMWFASFLVAAYVVWWVHDRREREDVPEMVIRARLLPPLEAPTPSVTIQGGGVALGTSTVAPQVFERDEPSASLQDDELAGLTRAELYRRAREADIKGRSAMSKDQLAAALRAHTG
jgi:hypothetical protein